MQSSEAPSNLHPPSFPHSLPTAACIYSYPTPISCPVLSRAVSRAWAPCCVCFWAGTEARGLVLFVSRTMWTVRSLLLMNMNRLLCPRLDQCRPSHASSVNASRDTLRAVSDKDRPYPWPHQATEMAGLRLWVWELGRRMGTAAGSVVLLPVFRGVERALRVLPGAATGLSGAMSLGTKTSASPNVYSWVRPAFLGKLETDCRCQPTSTMSPI